MSGGHWMILVLMFVGYDGCVQGLETVPSLYVFGDSLMDTGNNRNLSTFVKAPTPPYADYPKGTNAGGRFSDGAITTDYIASMLGLPSPPPYLFAGDNILKGMNFASGGSGILDPTGYPEEHISLRQQIDNFKVMKAKLVKKVGRRETERLTSKGIYMIQSGGNDYLFGYYFIPRNPSYDLLTPQQFEVLVVDSLVAQLKRLYSLGARKFVVSGMPILGCAPSQTSLYNVTNGTCVEFLQQVSRTYNTRLLDALKDLKRNLSGSHFMFNNVFETSLHVYNNPTQYGISNLLSGCCGGSVGFGLCFDGVPVCKNPRNYYFFDGFHPTSKVHHLTSRMTFQGGYPYVYPWNLKTMASVA